MSGEKGERGERGPMGLTGPSGLDPHRGMRFSTVYFLIGLCCVLLVVTIVMTLVVTKLHHRVTAGCERGNVVREAARMVLTDPRLATPEWKVMANKPELAEQPC